MTALRSGSCALLLLVASFSFACSSDDGDDPILIGGSGQGGQGASGTPGLPGVPNPGAGGGGIVVTPGTGGATTMPPMSQSPVNVVITADNAYGFGYGTDAQLLNYFGGIENPASPDIYACGTGPEPYTVPADDANLGNFLYIIGYADKSTTQGVIAKFFREGGQPVFTGSGNWQGCATGMDFDPGSGGPPVELINQQIAACNAGGSDPSTTSGGWVSLVDTDRGRVVFGEDNSTERDRPEPGNEFRIACEIDAQARWMWYDWVPNRTEGSAFIWPGGAGNPTKDFVIFRLGAEFVPPGPPR